MSRTFAVAVAVAVAGAVALVGILTILVRYCLSNNRTNSRRSSDTSSSDPSVQVGRNVELSLTRGITYTSDLKEAHCFLLEELNLAAKSFSDINLIGSGAFGEVYKGLLPDGMLVAIKRRLAAPSQELVEEVRYMSSIRHRNLVSLFGYCQENDLQMLIYEFVPNGSISTHLYGASQASNVKLEFKHRLSIAYGTAKGLSHLHSQNPPLVHGNFKTADCYVDEDFIPKVGDAGLRSLLDKIDSSSSSFSVSDDLFLDPEVKESQRFSVKSDVYSFGVFLLELITGREAKSDPSILEMARDYQESNNFSSIVDHRMGNRFTSRGILDYFRLICWCLNPSGERRPPMNFVVFLLDRMREKEMNLTTVMGDGTTTITLGSELFKR